MSSHRHLGRFGLWLAVLFIAAPLTAQAADTGLPTASPPSQGFSADRLERLDTLLQGVVDNGDFAGASMAVARHGRTVYEKAFGLRDLESEAPMTTDTLVRIYSMTKPVTGVAMMILFEEGKWELDDPVFEHIPEFADLKVYAGDNEDGLPKLVEPDHPMTMRELMTHTGGLTYGAFGDTPVDQMYREKDVLGSGSLQEMIDKLATIPLLYQPGTRWNYSISVDVQGYLVEKLSGQSFPSFLEERIFDPLGMTKTGFYVENGDRDDFATLYTADQESGNLRPVAGDDFGAGDYASAPDLASGGAGLVSTLGDYLRFAQMMLNGGELGDARIISPRSVDLMRADHLPEKLEETPGIGLSPGVGFGLDFAVVNDPMKAGALYGKGTYYWGGAAGTWFWIDPEFDIVAVGMVQRMMSGPNMHNLSRTAVYQALVSPDDD